MLSLQYIDGPITNLGACVATPYSVCAAAPEGTTIPYAAESAGHLCSTGCQEE